MTRAPGQRPQAVVNRGWRREIKRRLWEHKSFVAISSCRIAMCPLYLVRSLARSSSLLIIVRAHGCMSLWRHVCAGGLGWVERWRWGKEKNFTARRIVRGCQRIAHVCSDTDAEDVPEHNALATTTIHIRRVCARPSHRINKTNCFQDFGFKTRRKKMCNGALLDSTASLH